MLQSGEPAWVRAPAAGRVEEGLRLILTLVRVRVVIGGG